MREGMLHIHDVEVPKNTGSMETRLEAMEQQVFKCQGMVERGLNANHMMITEFTNKHRIDANDIGKHLSRLYDRIGQLQAQIYDLQNQNSADVEVLDPVEIEDEDEVGPRPVDSGEIEGVAQSEGTELAGKFPASALLDWANDDERSPPLRGAVTMEDLEKLEDISSPPVRWQR
ncbi:40S ribosomal protein S5-1 [Hordeum vulgare]|nr:40S ribosomal protein S5-1 [Hordeum vulgare]